MLTTILAVLGGMVLGIALLVFALFSTWLNPYGKGLPSPTISKSEEDVKECSKCGGQGWVYSDNEDHWGFEMKLLCECQLPKRVSE